MIPEAELAQLRADMEATLPDVATILDPVASEDASGGSVTTWTPRTSTVAARVTSGVVRAIEAPAGGSVVARAYYEMLFPHGTNVGPLNRIEVAGIFYEVIGHGDFRSESLVMRLQVQVATTPTPLTP
jgi:hypothetical protein